MTDLTWVDPEERAYPHGGFTRKGRAVLRENVHNPIALPYGEVRAIRCSIPDTYFTIPARLRYRGQTVVGFLQFNHDDVPGAYSFTPEADPDRCVVCAPNDGCRYNPERIR